MGGILACKQGTLLLLLLLALAAVGSQATSNAHRKLGQLATDALSAPAPLCSESLADTPLAPSLVPNDFSGGRAPAAWECYMCRRNSSRLHVPRNKRWVETPRHALLNTSSGVAVTVNNLQPGWTHQILAWVRLVNTTTSHTLSVCFIPHVNGNRCAGAVTVVQAGCWTQVQGGFTPATASAKMLLSGVPAGVGMQVHSFVVAALDPAQERARQAQLIDQHRKSDVVVHFQTSAGAPVAGAAYTVEQVRSGFPWGVDINPTVAQQPAYSAFLQSLFNQVQLWCGWTSIERVEGQFDFADVDVMLAWAAAHGMAVNGPALIWEDLRDGIPQWVQDKVKTPADKAVLDQLISRFIDAIMGHFSGKVNSYTVDNEGLHKTFVNDMGGDDSIARLYKEVRANDPTTPLIFNEYNVAESCWHDFGDPGTPEALVAHVRRVQGLGGDVDIVGLQFQVQPDQTDPTRFRQSIAKIAQLGLPIWVTELNWALGVRNDTARAALAEVALRELFSNPAVAHISLQHIVPSFGQTPATCPTCLFDEAGAPNEVGQVFLALRQEWATRGVAGTTSSDGAAQTFRGFHGDYQVEINGQFKYFSILQGVDGVQSVTITL